MDLSTRDGRRAQGKLIQAAAKEANLSAEDVARIAGCSRALIYQYYSGATLVQTDRLQKIARALGRSMAHFFGEEGVPPVREAERDQTPKPPEPQPAGVQEPQAGPRSIPRDIDAPNLATVLEDLEQLARAQSGGPDPHGLLATCQRIIALSRLAGDRKAEADALFRCGLAQAELGRHAEAVDPLTRARELYALLGDASSAMHARQALGASHHALGRFDEAAAEFVRVASGVDWECRWRGRIGLAALHEQSGEFDRALEDLAGVLADLDDAPNPESAETARCFAVANQGNVYLGLGEYASALEAAEECERSADLLGLGHQRVEALVNAGMALTALGELGRGRRTLDLARSLARALASESHGVVCRAVLAWNAAEAGRFEEALGLAREAARDAARGADDRTKALAQWMLARVCDHAGKAEESRFHAEEAVRLLEASHLTAAALEARALLDEDLTGVADRARERGVRPAEMEACLRQGAPNALERALALANAMGRRDGRIRALAALATVEAGSDAERGRVREAVAEIEALRASETPEMEAVLEDPLRLAVCRRWLALLLAADAGAAEEWLDATAWPPLSEAGPAEGWAL